MNGYIIFNGGTLDGTNSINTLTFSGGGTVTFGNGDAAQDAFTLKATIDYSDTTYIAIKIGGATTSLSIGTGTKMIVSAFGTFTVANTWTVISDNGGASNNISGTFGTITNPPTHGPWTDKQGKSAITLTD